MCVCVSVYMFIFGVLESPKLETLTIGEHEVGNLKKTLWFGGHHNMME